MYNYYKFITVQRAIYMSCGIAQSVVLQDYWQMQWEVKRRQASLQVAKEHRGICSDNNTFIRRNNPSISQR